MSEGPRIGINGFGRIGRLVTRAIVESNSDANIVAINDLSNPEMMAHLFEYDTIHGRFKGGVEVKEGDLRFDGDTFRVLHERDPANLPWGELGADIVVEATGRFRTREDLEKHLKAGAGRVLLTAPAREGGADITLCRGINDEDYDPTRHHLVSNASCTTNALALMLKVLNDEFGVEHAVMTTVHAYTNDQRLLDSQHKDYRRARAATLNMLPSTTGAAKAIDLVLPELAGKVKGMAIRVPVPDVSLVDLNAELSHDASIEEILGAFRAAQDDGLTGLLRVEERELVSSDFVHEPTTCVIDAPAAVLVDDCLVKLLGWYDNEWGYALRCSEVLNLMWEKER